MPHPVRTDVEPDPDLQVRGLSEDDDLRAMLMPIVAGARARGVADGLEMLGVGAVLMDAMGRVLHVGGRGRRLMGGWLRIVEGHLVAEQPRHDRAVEGLICGAIAEKAAASEIRLEADEGLMALSMKALPFTSDEGSAQRLHAILILDEVHLS